MGCWDAISDVGISTSFGYSSSGILTGSERPSTSHEQRFPETPLTRLTLLLVLIQAIIVITLEAVVAALFIRNVDMVQDTPAKGIPVYLVMFCTSQVFMGAVCWDAVGSEATMAELAMPRSERTGKGTEFASSRSERMKGRSE